MKGEPVEEVTIAGGGVAEKQDRLMPRDVQEAGWYIASEPPGITMTPLGEESFQAAIMEVTGG